MPSSRARRRTPGLAWTPEKSAIAGPWCPRRTGVRRGRSCDPRRWGRGGDGAAAEEDAAADPPSGSMVTIVMPWLTLSPCLTKTLAILPATDDGTSIVALSDSKRDQRIVDLHDIADVHGNLNHRHILVVADIRNLNFDSLPLSSLPGKPASDSRRSQMVSLLLPVFSDALDAHRVRFGRIDAVFLDRLGDLGRRQNCFSSASDFQCGDRNKMPVDLKEGSAVRSEYRTDRSRRCPTRGSCP